MGAFWDFIHKKGKHAIPPHKELDKQWGKLTKKYKHEALGHAKRMMAHDKQREAYRARIREAEKGKRVGEECTCLPEAKLSCNVDVLCDYCRWQTHEDWINSPG